MGGGGRGAIGDLFSFAPVRDRCAKYVFAALSGKFCRISYSVTEDAIAKLYVKYCRDKWLKISLHREAIASSLKFSKSVRIIKLCQRILWFKLLPLLFTPHPFNSYIMIIFYKSGSQFCFVFIVARYVQYYVQYL